MQQTVIRQVHNQTPKMQSLKFSSLSFHSTTDTEAFTSMFNSICVREPKLTPTKIVQLGGLRTITSGLKKKASENVLMSKCLFSRRGDLIRVVPNIFIVLGRRRGKERIRLTARRQFQMHSVTQNLPVFGPCFPAFQKPWPQNRGWRAWTSS